MHPHRDLVKHFAITHIRERQHWLYYEHGLLEHNNLLVYIEPKVH